MIFARNLYFFCHLSSISGKYGRTRVLNLITRMLYGLGRKCTNTTPHRRIKKYSLVFVLTKLITYFSRKSKLENWMLFMDVLFFLNTLVFYQVDNFFCQICHCLVKEIHVFLASAILSLQIRLKYYQVLFWEYRNNRSTLSFNSVRFPSCTETYYQSEITRVLKMLVLTQKSNDGAKCLLFTRLFLSTTVCDKTSIMGKFTVNWRQKG